MKTSNYAAILPQSSDTVDSNGNVQSAPVSVLELTVRELLTFSNWDTHIEHNKLDIQCKRPDATETLTFSAGTNVTSTTMAHAKRLKPWDKMWPDIARMRAEGKTQTEVARTIGSSQPTISRIERKHRNS